MTSEDEILKHYSLNGFLRRHPFCAKPVSVSDLELACRTFEAQEPRDSMYRVSTFLVREWWNDPARLVEALSVLLLVWNSAFYRYGGFNEQRLEDCLRQNQSTFARFRARNLSTFGEADHADTNRIFIALSEALQRVIDGVQSPVSAGKTLHLLAPDFFPLWDQYIAQAYRCPYTNEVPSVAYIVFCQRIRNVSVSLTAELTVDQSPRRDWLLKKTLLKRIDEYNYVTHTLPNLGSAKRIGKK
jgi:hypothetical protein